MSDSNLWQRSVAARLRSVRDAARGVAALLTSQHNAWLHAAATLGVCALALALRLGSGDWLWLVLAITLVWMAEAFNTALEVLADEAFPEWRPGVARAKDLSAAAVMIAALGAAIIGVLVLGPPLLERLAEWGAP